VKLGYGYAVLVLALISAPVGARGGEATQPMLAREQCSVPADVNWTPQEKFVWQHVCVGEIADFNIRPGYGGSLDPKAQGLPESQILRPSFLENILNEDKYTHALSRRGVIIIGARFTTPIELEDAQLQNDFALYQCLLDKGVNFARLRSTHSIVLSGSKVTGPLNMEGLQVDGSLFMRAMAGFGEVVLVGAHVGRGLDLRGSTFTGMLYMDRLEVGQDLLMRDNAKFSQVFLVGAHVGGDLDLTGSTVIGKVIKEFVFDFNLFMPNNPKLAAIFLRDASIGGDLQLSGSKVSGTLDMEGLQIGQSLLMKQGQFSLIFIVGSHIGGQLSLSGSKTRTLMLEDDQVYSTIFLGRNAEFDGVANVVFNKVGENLELADGDFQGGVDITGTQIGGEGLCLCFR